MTTEKQALTASGAMGAEIVRLSEQIADLHAKVDQLIAFNAVVAEAAAPFLSGKGHKWLALVAKAKGVRT